MKKLRVLSDVSDPLWEASRERWSHWANGEAPEASLISESNPNVFLAEAAALRVALNQAVSWLPACPVQPVTVSSLGVADFFVNDGAYWRPELLLEKALRSALVTWVSHLDLRSSAYVIGMGPTARVAASVALSLGYRDVKLVGEIEDLEEQKKILNQVFMGSSLQLIPLHDLTLQTVGASLLINTLVLAEFPDLAADLSYFNFMKKSGVVVDLLETAAQSTFLTEALRAHLRPLSGAAVQAERDLLSLEMQGQGVSPELREACLKAWDVSLEMNRP